MINPFGWELPPGVTHADVDRAAGPEPESEPCPVCGAPGKFVGGRMTCCGATARDIRYLIEED